MLDGWMIIQRRAIEKSKKQDEMLKTNNKLGKAQEVFIFTDSDEGIQEVMSMNSDEAIMDIAHREHVINKYQHIEHTELPDIQKETKNRN
jgi:5S rRNA maturation endonuclease (ribonuclease M5)